MVDWLDQGHYSNLGVSAVTDHFNYLLETGEEEKKEDTGEEASQETESGVSTCQGTW